MKILLAFAFALLAGIISSRGDIVVPRKPVSITVSNLSAFPQYKFLYDSLEHKYARAIVDEEPFTTVGDVDLLVQSGNELPQTWGTVKYNRLGGKVVIKIEGVKKDGKQISVTFKKSGDDSAPTKKGAGTGWSSAPFFALASLGACALVATARARRRKG